MSSSAPASGSASSAKRARRPRAIQACNFCRSKKYRCDGNLPCLHCCKHNLDCVFRKPEGHDPEAAAYSISYVKRLEKRLELAEAGSRKRRVDSDIPNVAGDQTDSSVADTVQYESPASVFPSPYSEGPARQSRTAGEREESDESAAEVVDVNPDTNAIEFHGNTSSLAFLGLVCEEYGSTPGSARHAHERRNSAARSPSLVTTFHNNAFNGQREAQSHSQDEFDEDFYSHQALMFLDTYFKNLHYIHPIIEQADIYRRCDDLWNGRGHRQSRSFKALYFSLLSLGALIRTWTEHRINGMSRFEWSRTLFQKAEVTLGRPGVSNDVHAVQALFIMAKVCQNELNPNMAYTYLGLAIRTALSAGLNRNMPVHARSKSVHVDCSAASKVWWGLYSLEVEMSFALGRPDTLGLDNYHNRPVPPADESEFSIIPCMLPMSRIMREISTGIYLTKDSMIEKVARASRLEAEMEAWIDTLPPKIRPSPDREVLSTRSLSAEIWPKLQALVLKIRYLNVKMILLRPFLLHGAKKAQTHPLEQGLVSAINRCVSAAAHTIDTIHSIYHAHAFFRTWWYNVTYTTFATSILLFFAAQHSLESYAELDCLASVDKALEILDVMEDGVVARKIADCLKPIIARLRERRAAMVTENGPKENTRMDMPYLGVPGFDGSWTGNPTDLDFFRTGINYLAGGLWDLDAGLQTPSNTTTLAPRPIPMQTHEYSN